VQQGTPFYHLLACFTVPFLPDDNTPPRTETDGRGGGTFAGGCFRGQRGGGGSSGGTAEFYVAGNRRNNYLSKLVLYASAIRFISSDASPSLITFRPGSWCAHADASWLPVPRWLYRPPILSFSADILAERGRRRPPTGRRRWTEIRPADGQGGDDASENPRRKLAFAASLLGMAQANGAQQTRRSIPATTTSRQATTAPLEFISVRKNAISYPSRARGHSSLFSICLRGPTSMRPRPRLLRPPSPPRNPLPSAG
jgi:hypothetical protein